MKERVLYELKKDYHRLLIFGAGKCCKVTVNYFGAKLIKRYVESIIVSDCSSNPEEIEGIPINDYKIYRKISASVGIIIALEEHNREAVVNMLRLEGFKNIIYIDQIFDYNNKEIAEYRERRNADIKDYCTAFLNGKELFKYIEIETINRCNGSCAFCPVNKNQTQREYNLMNDDLFESIIKQLSELEYNGLVGLFSNNEPFLDKRIPRFAQYARKALPKAFIYIYTNGTLLSQEILENIMPYLDYLQIDNYIDDNGKGMIDVHKREILLETVKELNATQRFRICDIYQEAIRTTRGGASPNKKMYYSMNDKCALPFVQMIIRPDGKVSLCCNDALGKTTLGDVNEESLSNIWFGKKYKKIREALLEGRENISMCKYCDNLEWREMRKTGVFK